MASAAGRLLQAYATQMETLRRLRHGGSHFVRVEHVHINEGGNALIGNVNQKDCAYRKLDPDVLMMKSAENGM